MLTNVLVTERDFKIHYPNKNLDVSNEAIVKNGELKQFVNLSLSHNESSETHFSYKYTKIHLKYNDAYMLGKWFVETSKKYMED